MSDVGYNLLSVVNLLSSNTIVSPFSLQIALALITFGATGDTLKEIQQFLQVNPTEALFPIFHGLNKLDQDNTETPYIFKSVNSVWGNILVPEYAATLKRETNTEVYALEKAEDINDWVKDKTNNLIELKLPPVDPLRDVFVINAIYFKGTWQHPFKASATVEAPFQTISDETVPCQMMQQTKSFEYLEKSGVGQILVLPYKKEASQRSIDAIVFLPSQGTSIASLVAQPELLKEMLLAPKRETRVTISLPRFKIEATHEKMDEMLQKLGVRNLFTPEAELDKMIQGKPTKVSKIIQKVFIEVDEKGTEAAAVTSIQIMCMSLPPPSTDMHCDRPFLFAIRDTESHHFLFLGIVGDASHF